MMVSWSGIIKSVLSISKTIPFRALSQKLQWSLNQVSSLASSQILVCHLALFLASTWLAELSKLTLTDKAACCRSIHQITKYLWL